MPDHNDAYEQVTARLGFVSRRLRDSEPVVYLRCPGCKTRGEIDEDQLHGRVSVICDSCGFHETRNWFMSALTCPWEWEFGQPPIQQGARSDA